MNHTTFFPRDKLFWIYHCGISALWGVLQILLYINEPALLTFNIISMVISLCVMTITVLYFRKLYRLFHLVEKPVLIQIIWTLMASVCFAIIQTLVIFALTLPFLQSSILWQQYQLSNIEFVITFLINNSLTNFLIMSVWSFAYISFSNNRSAEQVKIKNLILENNLKDAQLLSLSNQINPHFIFNSLNNILFTIHDDADQAEEMIVSFSEILRYSLEMEHSPKVLIKKEVHIIECYLDILKMQYEDKLNVDMNIEEGVNAYLMPPMLIQMLLENAIKHGVEHAKNPVTILIELTSHEDSITLLVSNPKLFKSNPHGTQVGLKNIQQRLFLLYGERAKLSIDDNDRVFEASVVMPKECYENHCS